MPPPKEESSRDQNTHGFQVSELFYGSEIWLTNWIDIDDIAYPIMYGFLCIPKLKKSASKYG